MADASQAMHNCILLNDNRDGTFSVSGRYTEIVTGKTRPPIVKSKDALPEDASPLMEPQPPPPWADAKLREGFSAGQAGLRSRSLTSALQGAKRTVDELMFTANPVSPTKGASQSSVLSELSDSAYMSDLALSEPGSGSGLQHHEPSQELGAVLVEEESEDETTTILEAMNSAARQNWELIRKHFTIRQFPPPKAGSLSKLLSQPRRREIVLNANFQVTVGHPKTVSLLIVQLLGDEAPVPCDCCSQGRGPFRGCVALSKAVAAEVQNGVISCANCAYKGRHQGTCNLKELLLQYASLDVANDSRLVRQGHHGNVAAVQNTSSTVRGITSLNSGEVPLSMAAPKQPGEHIQHRSSFRKGSSLSLNLATKTLNSRSTKNQDLDARLDGLDTSEAGSAHQAGARIGAEPLSQYTKIDGRFDFRVIAVPTGTALQFQPDYSHFRLCSLVTGKVMVRLNGETPFNMGAGGVLKIVQGVSGGIVNSSGISAVLHVSSIQT